MSDSGYNIVYFAGRLDADLYDGILNQFPLGYCVGIAKDQSFLPELNCSESDWCHPYLENTIDWNTITPLDEKTIEQMRACEIRALTMMDRLEGRGITFTYQQRKRLYLQMLRFADHILTKKKINLVLTTDVPHHALTYVFFSLCKEKGVPFLFPFHTDPFVDTYHLQNDWRDPVPTLREHYSTLQEQTPDPAAVELSPAFEDYFREQSGIGKKKEQKKEAALPWYMSFRVKSVFSRWLAVAWKILKKNPLSFLWHALLFLPRRCNRSYIQRRLDERRAHRRFRQLARFYDEHATAPDYTKCYIYIPLQMQPEATTLPMGGAYVDQILIVQMLSALVPDDVELYVREHPMQQVFYPDGKGRSQRFYEDFLRCRNVKLMALSESTYRLTEGAVAVATTTGTPGLEGLLRGKPVLMYGERYYQYAHGVFRIRTVEDCKKALSQILDQKLELDPRKLRLFLKAVEDTVHPGTVHIARFDVSEFSQKENAHNVSAVIASEIQNRYGWKPLCIHSS